MGNEPRKRMRKVGRWINAGMCNGLISATVGLSVTKMGLSSRMVIGVVANGVAGAVTNGLQRLGLGLGSDHREWFATIGFGFGFGPSRMVLPEPSLMVRNDWVWVWVQTVANGYQWRFGSYRRWWGSTAIGFGSEARRRLGFKVKLYWVLVSEKSKLNWVFVKFFIYILKLLVTKLFSSL